MADELMEFDDSTVGVGMKGNEAHEQFNIGLDYRGLEIDLSVLPGIGTGQGIGVESAPSEPLQGNAMQGLDSDGMPFYAGQDQEHPVDIRGFDAHQGLAAHPMPAPLGEQDTNDVGKVG